MRLRELSIIQYQNISKTPQIYRLWLSVDAFQKQLKYLAAHNFHLLTIDEAIEYMERKKMITHGRPVSLSFDNGCEEFYQNVFPLLSNYRFPGTLLISPNKVGQSVQIEGNEVRYLSWEILKELSNNNITIGAYEDYAWNINQIPDGIIEKHIVEHKQLLEDRLGREIRYFGIKEGIPNNKTRDLLLSLGYRAFLTECPTNRKSDLFSIGRIQVDDDDFNIFLTKISRTYLFFKDRRSWKYIREYNLDKLAHKVSESWDKIRGA
jgi:peptidoglycan/xylan/chitin deacetylase (PgdA/CDA1 family)